MDWATKLQPWKLSGSEYIIRGDRWLTVRADKCITNEGVQVWPYFVLEFPTWVQAIVIDEDDRILLTRQYRHGIKRLSIEIPCGIMRSGDRTELEAAKRELLEETGYEGDFSLAGRLSPNPANHQNELFVYLVKNPRQVCQPLLSRLERIETRFVEMAELVDLLEAGQFPQALHVCGLTLALRRAGRLSKFAAMWESRPVASAP